MFDAVEYPKLTSAQVVGRRCKDALALLEGVILPKVREDWFASNDDSCAMVMVYEINVLFTKEEDYLTVSWFDTRAADNLYECEGLTPFLAYILRRYW